MKKINLSKKKPIENIKDRIYGNSFHCLFFHVTCESRMVNLNIGLVNSYYVMREISSEKHSRLSRSSTARGSCTGLVAVSPTTKV